MIIKSMSRKVPSFGQLLTYIDRDEGNEDYSLRHNLMGRKREALRAEFERNAALLMKRKNGVYLYHEIISLSRAQGLSPQEQKARLYEIAQLYVGARCPENLVYGGLHEDKAHSFHMHLMISSNRAGDAKRMRLTKAQFRKIQIETERHVLEAYPELEQKIAMDKVSERKLQKQEQELERRTGKRPKREEVLDRVMAAYAGSDDKQGLIDALAREDLELYMRGKTLGVVDLSSGKKHRLKTLDLNTADQIEIRMAGGLHERDLRHKQKDELRVDKINTSPESRVERAREDSMGKDFAESAAEMPREAARHVAHEVEEAGKIFRGAITPGEEKLGQTLKERDREDLENHMRDEKQAKWREEIAQKRAKQKSGPDLER